MTRKKRRALLRHQPGPGLDHDCPICALIPSGEEIDLGNGITIQPVTAEVMAAFAKLDALEDPDHPSGSKPGDDVS